MLLMHSDNPDELRARWMSESTDPMRGGSISNLKKGETMQATKTNFFLDMISEERESAAAVASAAQSAAETTRIKNVKANEKTLASHFGKLIEKELAFIKSGVLHIEAMFPNPHGIVYSVVVADGNFMLNVNGTPFEKFASNGDSIRSLAKLLAKDPQPKPASAPVAEITGEQRLRDTIKRFVAAFDELKKV